MGCGGTQVGRGGLKVKFDLSGVVETPDGTSVRRNR